MSKSAAPILIRISIILIGTLFICFSILFYFILNFCIQGSCQSINFLDYYSVISIFSFGLYLYTLVFRKTKIYALLTKHYLKLSILIPAALFAISIVLTNVKLNFNVTETLYFLFILSLLFIPKIQLYIKSNFKKFILTYIVVLSLLSFIILINSRINKLELIVLNIVWIWLMYAYLLIIFTLSKKHDI